MASMDRHPPKIYTYIWCLYYGVLVQQGVSWPTEIWCIYHSRKNVGRVFFFFLQSSQCGQTPYKSAAYWESCHITETRRHTGCWRYLLIEDKNPFLSLVGNWRLYVCLTACLRPGPTCMRESSGGGPDFCEINFFFFKFDYLRYWK